MGNKVECRCGSSASFYPGVISIVNSNGTYDITYNDGDRERSKGRNHIKTIPYHTCLAISPDGTTFVIGGEYPNLHV